MLIASQAREPVKLCERIDRIGRLHHRIPIRDDLSIMSLDITLGACRLIQDAGVAEVRVGDEAVRVVDLGEIYGGSQVKALCHTCIGDAG